MRIYAPGVSVFVTVLLMLGASALAASGATSGEVPNLKRYINRPDPAYSYRIQSTQRLGASTLYTVRLVSQKWEGITWKHWLRIIIPDDLGHRHKAVLIVVGGSDRDKPTDVPRSITRAFVTAAVESRAIISIIAQVPNEPLMNGRSEDTLIAYSFRQYLDGGNAQWPLLLPMVNSAVRAMDAIQAIVKQKRHLDLQHFIITGASKRGWTTWLTGAVDPRVFAIAPIVIDMLNFRPQMKQQLKTYGHYSKQISAYVNYGVIARFGTKRGKELLKAVDPYRYRDVLTMPKMIILATNDPYWTVDAANRYFHGLKGPRALEYFPNQRHNISFEILPTLVHFFQRNLNDKPMPKLDWKHDKSGALVVRWQRPGATATLWQAKSATRDFREAHWSGKPLAGSKQVTVSVAAPKQGYRAYFVAVTFPSPNPFRMTTTMTVLPKGFPYKLVKQADGIVKVEPNEVH